MNFILYVFYAEVLITALTATQSLLAPASFLRAFTPDSSPVMLEFVRWYGVMMAVTSLALFLALRARGEPLRLLLIALLLGDTLQIGVSFSMAGALGGWPLNLVLSAGTSVIFAAARIVALLNPKATGLMGQR